LVQIIDAVLGKGKVAWSFKQGNLCVSVNGGVCHVWLNDCDPFKEGSFLWLWKLVAINV
jgi:hypothetical protein